jgi:aminoglycoside phosphotransferase (APT) family kinase protein
MPLLRRDAGFPAPAELLSRYAQHTDCDLSAIGWYLAFGYFKLAVISTGIAARHAQGRTVGEGFAAFGGLVPHLIDQARGHLSRAGATH